MRTIEELINSNISAKELLTGELGKDFKKYCHDMFIRENTSNIVWHYTKMEVLEKIFPPKYIYKYRNGERFEINNDDYCEDKIKLRFTDIRYLNDPSEGLVLRKFYEENKDMLLNALPKNTNEKISQRFFQASEYYDRYIFSATHLEDSFAFWNKEYAGINGIAIGISTEKTKISALQVSTEYGFADVVYINPYEKIKSPEDHNIKQFSTLVHILNVFGGKLPSENIDMLLALLYSFYKHNSWEAENEARLIAMKEKDYFGIEFFKDMISKYHYEYIAKDIVVSVMLGPGCSNEQVDIVRNYLTINGYISNDNIVVSKSRALELRYEPTSSK